MPQAMRARSSLFVNLLGALAVAFLAVGCASSGADDADAAGQEEAASRAREEYLRRTHGLAAPVTEGSDTETADAGADEATPLTDTEEDMDPNRAAAPGSQTPSSSASAGTTHANPPGSPAPAGAATPTGTSPSTGIGPETITAPAGTTTGAPAGAPAGTTAGTSGETVGAAPTPPPGDHDGEILGILHAVHDGEMKTAELARTKATSAPVREYAQTMLRDHEQGVGLVQSIANLQPHAGQISQELNQKTTALLGVLQGQSGADFDRAYMDSQVLLHQQVLTVIDTQLLPGSSRAEVKQLVQTARGQIAAHLAAAQKLRATLGPAKP